MENRDRDKEAGDVNRQTSERQDQQRNDSDANFGQKIGRSEKPENEPSRRSGSDNSYYNTGSSSDSEH